ncbi:hypothetical protein CEXT_672511 [Caerostris extrusa]|uniref:Uncharacterized protein n=1 Tax=Caerostris extrusa TaxID=172846 RepID=A0AAV4PTF5_CAEEX|nr:hypothetical protein CEXT_672511 [Caerostris extrusa]
MRLSTGIHDIMLLECDYLQDTRISHKGASKDGETTDLDRCFRDILKYLKPRDPTPLIILNEIPEHLLGETKHELFRPPRRKGLRRKMVHPVMDAESVFMGLMRNSVNLSQSNAVLVLGVAMLYCRSVKISPVNGNFLH